ncbi:hypothetical protein NA63_1820 [Flavobacteriaceae bacterium MAR_2010_105]|nr:hypothetical protein NA63_1820 [Flavobacteriaceae bacterium MAR_2010_105]
MKLTILKTIPFLAICLCSLNNYAQTKEETISWLQEKLTKYIVSDLNFKNLDLLITVSSCDITIDYTYYDQYIHKNQTCKVKIPTDGVTIENGTIFVNGERIIDQDITRGTSKFINKFEYFNLKEGETDLRGRVKKALDHLSNFCPKKKETF